MRPPKCLSFFWLNDSIWLFARHSSPMLRSDLRWSEIMIRNGLKSLRFLVMAGWTPQKSWWTKVKISQSGSFTVSQRCGRYKGQLLLKREVGGMFMMPHTCELFLNHPRCIPKTSPFSLSANRDTLMVCVIFPEHEISEGITCSNSFFLHQQTWLTVRA